MSSCRRMCHTDIGSPIYYGYKRDGIYSFLDTVFLTGYNEKFVLNYTREDRIITLQYEAPHGYVQGQLLAFSGSLHTPLNINHRVIEVPSSNALKIYIKDDSFETYPESSAETGIQTKVAPFGWEKVYESPTQRSYRSRSVESSKVVFTIKQPTYNATKFITEGAICYEIDLSKDIDPVTGSAIDSCFPADKTSFGHTCRYWIVSSDRDDLFASRDYNISETPAPWTFIGDENMVYFISCPYEPNNDWGNKNSSYRQIDPYTGNYRYPKCYAFGDILPVNQNEYLTGSSFYFRFYYARSGSWEGQFSNSEYNPFIRAGNWSWWDGFFSAYDPIGNSSNARMMTIHPVGDNNYVYNAGSYLWNSYPQRVSGGLTYFDYLAYSDGPSAGRNSVNCFYKGVFKYAKYCDTNLTNIGNKGILHNKVHPTGLPYKFTMTVNNSMDYWHEIVSSQGYYVFELD